MLFWLTWARDSGSRRLLYALALAVAALVIVNFTKHSRSGLVRAPSVVVAACSKPIPALLALALAVLPQIVAPLVRPEPTGKPSVVVILLDTVRADHMGWGGCKLDTTPRLDALAKQGAAFTQAITQASWTKPSVASLLTGLVPGAHGAAGQSTQLPPDRRTLADAMSAEGYRTYGLSSNPNISYTFNFDQGFKLFHQGTSQKANELIARARNWVMPKEPEEGAFFLYLHLNDAHYPYTPEPVSVTRKGTQKIRGLFNPTGNSPVLDGASHDAFRMVGGIHDVHRDGGFTAEDIELMRLSYAEEIRWLDDQVGEFVEDLLAERDDVIVVICADHGEEFLDHGDLGHGHTLFEELVRVPLQIMWSKGLGERMGLTAGVRSEQVRLIDVLPTILETCDLQWPEAATSLHGASLLSGLRGAILEDRVAFAETDISFSPLSGPAGPLRMLREPGAKFVMTDPWFEQTAGRLWLFNLAQDPHERVNVAEKDPALLERMRRALERCGLMIQHDLTGKWQIGLNSKQQAELAAIGYAGDNLQATTDEESSFAPGTIPWVKEKR